MRIVGGAAKGIVLNSPASVTRPTSDRAREAFFSTLISEFGSIENLNFLDLYSGTGAIAAEALSRGAANVIAVEQNMDASEIIKSNFELVKKSNPHSGKFAVRQMSVEKYFQEKNEKYRFDIIYLDPPYEIDNINLQKIISFIASKEMISSSGLVALERNSKGPEFLFPPQFKLLKSRKYGQAVIFYGELAS